MINELIPLTQPKRVLTRTFTNTEYKIRLARPITEIDDFEEEIMALESAQNGDIVFMQLSSPGGSLETCDFICRRMNECEAPIVVEIGLTCASAASAMCLQASDWIIHDSSTMMVHACSYSPGYGKEVDVRAAVENTARINKEWVERTYRGFLTDEELEKVLDGKDLYFYADDLRERLPKYKQYREELEGSGCQCGNCNNDEEGMVNLDDIIEQKVKEILDKDKEADETKPKRRPKPKAKSKEASEVYKKLSEETPPDSKIDIQT